jgi:hypothetical protein
MSEKSSFNNYLILLQKGLLLAQQEIVTAAVPAEETSNIFLVSKWGCDGSTGHSQYKQKRCAERFSDVDLERVPWFLYSHFVLYVSEEKGRYISKQRQLDSSPLSGPKLLMS